MILQFLKILLFLPIFSAYVSFNPILTPPTPFYNTIPSYSATINTDTKDHYTRFLEHLYISPLLIIHSSSVSLSDLKNGIVPLKESPLGVFNSFFSNADPTVKLGSEVFIPPCVVEPNTYHLSNKNPYLVANSKAMVEFEEKRFDKGTLVSPVIHL